jgi:hypothetical protein
MRFPGSSVFLRVALFWVAGQFVFSVMAEDLESLVVTTNNSEVKASSEARNPVDQFRELLALRPTERRQNLTNRSPEMVKRILAKVREYESLKPDERELRLRATELRWYLLPLMSEPRTNRSARLAGIPEEQRKLVSARLEQWDLLPPPFQEQLLDSELTAHFFTQLQSASPNQRRKILNQMSPERRAKLEQGLEGWRVISEAQRQKVLQSFSSFFELSPEEKAKALSRLSEAEKQQMEKTLQTYAKLTPQQRATCIQSFEKFAGMSLAERQSFLKNAERWKLMSADERESWRNLVEMAPIYPPLPIGFSPPIPP